MKRKAARWRSRPSRGVLAADARAKEMGDEFGKQ
jgi:hypothetical protein